MSEEEEQKVSYDEGVVDDLAIFIGESVCAFVENRESAVDITEIVLGVQLGLYNILRGFFMADKELSEETEGETEKKAKSKQRVKSEHTRNNDVQTAIFYI